MSPSEMHTWQTRVPHHLDTVSPTHLPLYLLAIWQSTDRFSDRRGRCVSGRAVCVDMPRGPNGYVLCRVCQVRQVTTYALSTGRPAPSTMDRDHYILILRLFDLFFLRIWLSLWLFFVCLQVEVPPPKVTFCSPACVHEHRLRTSGTYVRQCLRVRETHPTIVV
jgi:hypothetical protein